MDVSNKQPKVFISYSWSSPGHQDRVRHWAERLVEDGIEVVLDIWDLKEGHDKYAFMEQMVTDESVTHVLVFSDSQYTQKANSRKAGVGTESEIISSEVYAKVGQNKFIPVVCEFESEEPCLPTFLKSRIWIDFSSFENSNRNWERLIRVLFDKPAHQKPMLGTAPAYITADAGLPANPARAKLMILKQAILDNRPRLTPYRQDFLDACIGYADAMRVRHVPNTLNLGQRVLDDCGKLKRVRDLLVDWVLIESSGTSTQEFGDAVIVMLERLLELKSRPPEVTQWNDRWSEAHQVFVYETFLYVVASLLKNEAFDCLKTVLTTHYLLPETVRSESNQFSKFDEFYCFSETLQLLAQEGQRLAAPAAELIRRQATRFDLTFAEVMQAELLAMLMTLINTDGAWYPQTLYYAQYGASFPFFVKAARRRDFLKLAAITGISTGNELRATVRAGYTRQGVAQWRLVFMRSTGPWEWMNMDSLDSLT